MCQTSKISQLLEEKQHATKKTYTSGLLHIDEEVLKTFPKPKIVDLNENEVGREIIDDYVNHPNHYKTENSAYEPIKVIHEWGMNFNIGSAVKYLARYKKKWNPIEDLKKAVFYIQDEIKQLEKNLEK